MWRINSTFERLNVIAFSKNHSDFHLSVSIHNLKKTYTRLMKFEGEKEAGGKTKINKAKAFSRGLCRLKNYITTKSLNRFKPSPYK